MDFCYTTFTKTYNDLKFNQTEFKTLRFPGIPRTTLTQFSTCNLSIKWALNGHTEHLEVYLDGVYLQTPRVFHSLMVLSLDPDTIWRLSAEKATLRTSLVCPTKRRVVVPLGEKNGQIQIDLTSRCTVTNYVFLIRSDTPDKCYAINLTLKLGLLKFIITGYFTNKTINTNNSEF